MLKISGPAVIKRLKKEFPGCTNYRFEIDYVAYESDLNKIIKGYSVSIQGKHLEGGCLVALAQHTVEDAISVIKNQITVFENKKAQEGNNEQ